MGKLLEGTPTDWLQAGYLPVGRTWKAQGKGKNPLPELLAKARSLGLDLARLGLTLVRDAVYNPMTRAWEEKGVYLYLVLGPGGMVLDFDREAFHHAFREALDLAGNPQLAWNYAYDREARKLAYYRPYREGREGAGPDLEGEDPWRELARKGTLLALEMERATHPLQGREGLYLYRTLDLTVGRRYDQAIARLAEGLYRELIAPREDNPPPPDWGPYTIKGKEVASGELVRHLARWAKEGWVTLQDGVSPEELDRIGTLRPVWGWGMAFGKTNPKAHGEVLFQAILD